MTYNKLTDNGIKLFEENVLEEVWALMEEDNYESIPKINIYVGKHHISVPMHADSFQALMQFLEKSK